MSQVGRAGWGHAPGAPQEGGNDPKSTPKNPQEVWRQLAPGHGHPWAAKGQGRAQRPLGFHQNSQGGAAKGAQKSRFAMSGAQGQPCPSAEGKEPAGPPKTRAKAWEGALGMAQSPLESSDTHTLPLPGKLAEPAPALPGFLVPRQHPSNPNFLLKTHQLLLTIQQWLQAGPEGRGAHP